MSIRNFLVHTVFYSESGEAKSFPPALPAAGNGRAAAGPGDGFGRNGKKT